MSDDPSPFGTLSDGSTLLGETGPPASPGPGPTPPPRRSWLPVAVALVAVVVLTIFGGTALLVLSSGDDSSSPPASTQAAPTGTDARPTPEQPAVPAPPAEPERAAILSPKGTAQALRAVRREAGRRPAVTLRIDPDRVTAIVRGKVIVYNRDGDVQSLPGPTSTTFGFSLGDVDDAAPARIDRAVREKGKRIEYVVYVVNPITKDVTWTIVTKDGKNYSADPSGRRICKLAFRC